MSAKCQKRTCPESSLYEMMRRSPRAFGTMIVPTKDRCLSPGRLLEAKCISTSTQVEICCPVVGHTETKVPHGRL
jgi:hypothetical protein